MSSDLQKFIDTFNVICPVCRGKVVLKEGGAGILCTECRRVYPVENGIPALVAEAAVVENEEPPKSA